MEEPIYPQNVDEAIGQSTYDRQLSSGLTDSGAKLIEFLVKDSSIPKHIRKNIMWGFSDKEMAISNLDERGIERVMTSFSIANKFYLMSKPDYKHTWEDELDYANMRGKMYVKLRRSIDGFERKMEVSQIKESYYSENMRRQSGGIMSGIKGMFSRLMGGGR